MPIPKKPSRISKARVKKVSDLHQNSTRLRTWADVLHGYAWALKQYETAASGKNVLPELAIKQGFRLLFPDLRIEGRRDWRLQNPLALRQAFKTLDGSLLNTFRFVREIVLPCYLPEPVAEMYARYLAEGENFGKEFEGLTLTPQQQQSVTAPRPHIHEALQGLLFLADRWPTHYETPETVEHIGRCLRTVAQVLEDRRENKIKSLDVAFGFSASGSGFSSDRKKARSKRNWDENCFDIHVLYLAGESLTTACKRYVRCREIQTHSGSSGSLEKMYHRWRKEPVTAVRLHLGDPLAKRVLALPDVRDFLRNRFPPHRTGSQE